MDLDEYALRLGRLVANLHSLEISLRAYLVEAAGWPPPSGVDPYSAAVGALVPIDDFTSYAPLGELLERFNKAMRQAGTAGIDPGLVMLRDALAHGRVSARTAGGTLRLVKFGREDKVRQTVAIAFREDLTPGWLTAQTKRVGDAIGIVQVACMALQRRGTRSSSTSSGP